MSLTEKPTVVAWPKTHYVFVEKIGPFQETAQKAWMELHAASDKVKGVKGAMALYKMKPQMVYRAGWIVENEPKDLPPGFQHVIFDGGKYSKFTYVGPYQKLPEICGKVFESVKTLNIDQRADFYIESYLNSPATTPENDLITEILIPTK
jgi:predicted transcriptional regulator YdeE